MDSNAIGTQFAAATEPESLTIEDGKLYWIDGLDVMSANLDGSDLSLVRAFGLDPSSIAVNPPEIASVPEASTWTMMLAGSAGVALIARRRLRKSQQQGIARSDLGSRSAGCVVATL